MKNGSFDDSSAFLIILLSFRFKYKYHPDEFPKRRAEQRQIIQKRLDTFMDLHNKGYLKDVSVDIDHQRTLTRFLDAGKRFILFRGSFPSSFCS